MTECVDSCGCRDISEGNVFRFHETLISLLSCCSDLDKENEEGRAGRGPQGNGPLMKHLSDSAREASATRVNRSSEEAETLHEIADILLLLKQRKNEG